MTNKRNDPLGNKQDNTLNIGPHETLDKASDAIADNMAKGTASDRALFYKPLRGHHLLTFIACHHFEQVASIIQHHIPQDAWEHIQLWETGPVLENINQESINQENINHQYWIQLTPPIRLNCQALQGQAFIAHGIHHLAAEVIESGEVSDLLNAPVPCLIWLAFGKLQSIQKSALVPVDCHKLLSPLAVSPLPLWAFPSIQETASAIHNQFHGVKETSQALELKNFKPNPSSKAFLKAVAQGTTMPEANEISQETSGSGEQRTFRRRPKRSIGQWFALSMMGGIFAGSNLVRQILKGNANARTRGRSATSSANPSAETPSPAPKRPSPLWPNRLLKGIGDYWRKQVMRSQLGAIIGKRQAKYFHRMMQQFEQGDLTEALKMAVPLSDYRDALGSPTSPAFGLPGKRQNLAISRRKAAGGQSFNFAEDSYAQMRAMYDKAYERLKKEGQPKEAAFVLAELLNRIAEAVDYLEKEGFLKEAAEIAESRLENPDKAIKLWMQAGDTERAINLAIRSNRFRAALMLLEEPKQFDEFEALWITRLIQSGDFETLFHYYASNADLNNRYTRSLIHFFREVLPCDYLVSPVWLARYSCFLPWGDIEASLKALFENPLESDFITFGQTFFTEINQRKNLRNALKSLALQPLLKEWYRQIVTYRDHLRQFTNPQVDIIRSLIDDRLFLQCKPKVFDNPFVSADSRASHNKKNTETTFQFHPGEPLIKDIGLTADGRFCVAMGALGVRLYNVRGRLLRHVNIPADTLVSPMTGDIVLAVEHREKLHRVHRIQLHSAQEQFLGQQPLVTFGRRHSGATWPVALKGGGGDRVFLIDVAADNWTSLWNTGNLDGLVQKIVSSDTQLTFELATEQGLHLWQYRLPSLRLGSRAVFDKIADVTTQKDTTLRSLKKHILDNDGQIYRMDTVSPVADEKSGLSPDKRLSTQLYRSQRLAKYQHIGQLNWPQKPIEKAAVNGLVEAEAEWLEGSGKILYGDMHLLVMSFQTRNRQQLIKVFDINRTAVKLLFNVEIAAPGLPNSMSPSAMSPSAISLQANKNWVALGHSDQLLLYNLAQNQGQLIKLS